MKKIIYLAFSLLLATSLQAQIDRSVQPKPGPAPKINLGKPSTFELPNGLKVIVVENHKLPRVSFTLRLDNPPLAEGNLKGADDLASSMMGNGTSKISKDDFNQKLEFYGSNVSFNLAGFRGSSLSRYFPEVLKLAVEGGLDPLFDQAELDSERAKLIDELKAGEKSASGIAKQVQATLVYGANHPFGEYLTEQTINNVTLADVQRRYKESYVPQNAYLIIVGDVKFADVKKQVTSLFSSWKKGAISTKTYATPQNVSATEINFVDLPNAVQSELSVNNIVELKMKDSDFFAAMLANQIIGGGADGRLFKNLREAHGWTYGAYSRMGASKYVSSYSATASVRNAVTDSAVVELMNELKRINTELPTQHELDLAKAKYIGSFVMNVEDPQMLASFALNEKIQSLPADFYENYIKNINAVTLDQVHAAAKKYILADNARIVIVGKASEVLPGLESLGLTINYFDKYGNPTSKPVEQAVDASVTAKSVIEKYINAIGGTEKLKSIKTVYTLAKGKIQGQEVTIVKKETADGKSLQEMSVMGNVMSKTLFDGQKAYAVMGGKKQELDAEQTNALKSEPFPELSLLNKNLSVNGIENIDGADAYKIGDGNRTYYYSVESGLKIAEDILLNINGNSMTQRVLSSDYRDVQGVKVPYTIVLNAGMEIKVVVEDVKFNEGVSNSDFE